MGACSGKGSVEGPRAEFSPEASPSWLAEPWSPDMGNKLQDVVDRIFERPENQALKSFGFSFTIADPNIEDCPLIGCSTGFADLCGYCMDEIVGRNCRFLLNSVPPELINKNVQRWSRQFCEAVRNGEDFQIPATEREPWMPEGRHSDDGLFCVQKNARKDGSLFNNAFYLKMIELNDRRFIVGLQFELPDRSEGQEVYAKAMRILDKNMWDVQKQFSRTFWVMSSMARQEETGEDDGYESD
mmetsp:Transcript_112345/g.317513  ORF Transcript_112345/g.317513 Transcript_112345/m.317513 type:complete len:242 (+) Transcript_112345:98-823(+)